MCCLFGIIDCKKTFSPRQKNRLMSALATAAEERGTDATGIAYNEGSNLQIYKRPKAGHRMSFELPGSIGTTIIGHTRLTTQGNADKNYNNHPFRGNISNHQFALAHNGVIWNDDCIKESFSLPKSFIETDSFIAVQLLERNKSLNFDSLKFMAEQLRGSFTFTILDDKDNLYIVKGENPLCIYYYADKDIYVYASTEQILKAALKKFKMRGRKETVQLHDGDILRISSKGKCDWSHFNQCNAYDYGFFDYEDFYQEESYLEDLKFVASTMGYDPNDIDFLLEQGLTLEEIEEFLY